MADVLEVSFYMYVALYRKWRPKMFDDVVSQTHITSTLKNEIKNQRIAHAYLFTGSRGTGKTTCAKIFSKAINCLNNKNGEPCCECSVCKGLDNGSILDVIEIDGASNNSVSDVRLLRDEANFVPNSCRYRVYIIDEAHMLSVNAFNALLKIMEEPPEYVVFILATTEIHKIPVTILSRCQRFDFKRIDARDIQDRLVHISATENFELSQEAAYVISRLSDGSMRDAISVLDQCTSVTNSVTVETVNGILDLIDKTYILKLRDCILNKNASEAIKVVDLLYQSSVDIQYLCSELIRFYREIMLSLVLDSHSYQSMSSDEFYNITQQTVSGNLDLLCVLKYLDLLQNCSEDLKSSSNKRLRFEICILKLCLNSSDKVFSKLDVTSSISNKLSDSKNCQSSYSTPALINDVGNVDKEKPRKHDNQELKSSKSIVPLDSWQDILNDIRDKDTNGMLFGFLAGSQAFAVEDKLYINSKNSIVAEKILEKKAFISDIIKSRTGKNYRIFLKKTTAIKNNKNRLENFLVSAENAGIAIDEE